MKHQLINKNIRAALFDLDGVILDTEPQYSRLWEQLFDDYYDGQRELAHTIKGQTLVQIFEQYFSGEREALREELTARIDAYELTMQYPFIEGFESFFAQLRTAGIATAVVTSSNQAKMENVFRAHPEFYDWFDAILTSEDFERSKPDPDCYLKAAARLHCQPAECVVFEDSFNGLRSGRAAGATVVGLATTNPAAAIAPLCDIVLPTFTESDKLFS